MHLPFLVMHIYGKSVARARVEGGLPDVGKMADGGAVLMLTSFAGGVLEGCAGRAPL
jgi:hypothetical protein